MKGKSKTSGLILLATIATLMVLFTWQLGIFNMGGTTVTATGFAKIKPQLAGTGLTSDGKLYAIMTNGVGTQIELEGIEVKTNGKTCKSAFADRKKVAAGTNFEVTAKDCAQGYPGDVYDARIDIDYSVYIGGHLSKHYESGTLRGPYEGGYSTPRKSNSYYNQRGQVRDYYPSSFRSQSYRLHKSFDFGWMWPAVILLCMASLVKTDDMLKKMTSSPHVQLFAMYSMMFLLCSTMILVFGIDHMIMGQDNPDIMLRLRYGWLLESTVYMVIGCMLAAAAELVHWQEGGKKHVLAALTTPLMTIYVYTVMALYPLRVILGVLSMSYDMRLGELAWIAEIVILTAIAVAYYTLTRSVMSKQGRPYVVYTLRTIAPLYLIMAIASFIWGMNTLIYSTAALDVRGILISVLMAVGGVALYVLGRTKPKMKERERKVVEPVVEL